MFTMNFRHRRPHQLSRRLHEASTQGFYSAKSLGVSPGFTFTDTLEAPRHGTPEPKSDQLELNESYLYSLSMCGS